MLLLLLLLVLAPGLHARPRGCENSDGDCEKRSPAQDPDCSVVGECDDQTTSAPSDVKCDGVFGDCAIENSEVDQSCEDDILGNCKVKLGVQLSNAMFSDVLSVTYERPLKSPGLSFPFPLNP